MPFFVVDQPAFAGQREGDGEQILSLQQPLAH